MTALVRIVRLWRPQAGWLIAGLLVSLAALGSLLALLSTSALLAVGGVAAGVAMRRFGIARVVLRYFERLVTHSGLFRALAGLRVWFFRGLAERSAGGLGFRDAGDLLARLVNDVEALDAVYLLLLLPFAACVLLLPVLFVLFGTVSPWLGALVGLLFALSAFVLPWRAARRSLAGGERLTRAAATLRVACLDTLTGLREVRAFAAEAGRLALIQSSEAAQHEAEASLSRQAAFALPWLAARRSLAGGERLTHAAATLRVACLDTLAGLREVRAFAAEAGRLALIQSSEAAQHDAEATLSRQAALAQAAAFLCAQFGILAVLLAAGAHPGLVFAAAAAFELAGGMPRAGVLAGHAAAAAARLLAVAEGPIPVPDPAIPAAFPRTTALRFNGVQFRWAPDRPPVFDSLTIDIPAGHRIAILGPSGSGKSTLAALALKVVTPTAGQITLGGTDIATLAATDLRHHIAWLGQTTHLFADTIRNNLLLGRPDANETDLWAALEAAQIADLVRTLPDSLNTYLGEAGANFSGGQARRLALARALLSNAPILILDEPCAGLDASTERDFHTTLTTATPGRTTILIAHRLTGAETLDRIYRLTAGHAVAAAR